MKRPAGRFAAIFSGWVLAIVCLAHPAFAESHRVAAVDPDDELARALDVALSPWGTIVTSVHVGAPGTSIMLSSARAKEIADATKADVVVWVAGSQGRYAVWIYDVASDWSSLRELSSSPPFNATTSAAVALSVKALLRFTVVAPPLERYSGTTPEATWEFGLTGSVAVHFGDSATTEGRGGVYVGYWPDLIAHRFGIIVGVSASPGLTGSGPLADGNPMDTVSATLFDLSLRGALGYRFPVSPTIAFEPSAGISGHLLFFSSSFNIENKTVQGDSRTDFAPRFDGQLALKFAMLGGLVHLAPWLGGSITMIDVHQYRVMGGPVLLEDQRYVFESGLRAEFGIP